jgi:hypothetical protein
VKGDKTKDGAATDEDTMRESVRLLTTCKASDTYYFIEMIYENEREIHKTLGSQMGKHPQTSQLCDNQPNPNPLSHSIRY